MKIFKSRRFRNKNDGYSYDNHISSRIHFCCGFKFSPFFDRIWNHRKNRDVLVARAFWSGGIRVIRWECSRIIRYANEWILLASQQGDSWIRFQCCLTSLRKSPRAFREIVAYLEGDRKFCKFGSSKMSTRVLMSRNVLYEYIGISKHFAIYDSIHCTIYWPLIYQDLQEINYWLKRCMLYK